MSQPGDIAGHPEPVSPGLAPASAQVSLVTVLREWGRIGCIGFRRPARPHQAAARAVRRAQEMARTRPSSRTRSPPATCCPARPPPSWRSSAPGGSAAAPARWPAEPRSSSRADRDPRPGRPVPGRLPAAVGTRRRRGRRGRRPRRRRPGRRWSLARRTAGGRRAAAPRAGRPTWLAGAPPRPPSVVEWLVAVLLGLRRDRARRPAPAPSPGRTGARGSWPPCWCWAACAIGGGVLLSVAWVAFKVGALSYGGGFVIIPLMQSDAVVLNYHWMTAAQFLNAVALGQITPGPGRADRGGRSATPPLGWSAASWPAVVAFTPSFSFVLLGAGRFDLACAAIAGPAPSSAGPGPPRSWAIPRLPPSR